MRKTGGTVVLEHVLPWYKTAPLSKNRVGGVPIFAVLLFPDCLCFALRTPYWFAKQTMASVGSGVEGMRFWLATMVGSGLGVGGVAHNWLWHQSGVLSKRHVI